MTEPRFKRKLTLHHLENLSSAVKLYHAEAIAFNVRLCLLYRNGIKTLRELMEEYNLPRNRIKQKIGSGYRHLCETNTCEMLLFLLPLRKEEIKNET